MNMYVHRLPALAAGVLVLVVLLAAATATAADGDPAEPEGAVPVSSSLGDAIETLEPAAREEWSDTFAGLWVDQADESVESISIAFTEDAETKVARLAESFPEPGLLRAVAFEHSIDELEARQMEMVADREAAAEGDLQLSGIPEAKYNLGIDVRRNEVYVVVENATDEAITTLESRYGNDIQVREGELGEPLCTRADCRYNMRAGLRTNLSTGGHCTAGFTVRVPGTSNRNVLSAGHCGPVGQIHRHGGERYGVVRERRVQGRVDAMRVGPPEGSFNMNPRIFVNVNNKSVAVKSRSTWSGLALGVGACKAGATTHHSCGQVFDKHFSPHWVPNSNRFIRAMNCSEGGDSGSPFFRQDNWNRVHGILSGGAGTCSQTNSWSVHGHLEYVVNQLNAALVTVD